MSKVYEEIKNKTIQEFLQIKYQNNAKQKHEDLISIYFSYVATILNKKLFKVLCKKYPILKREKVVYLKVDDKCVKIDTCKVPFGWHFKVNPYITDDGEPFGIEGIHLYDDKDNLLNSYEVETLEDVENLNISDDLFDFQFTSFPVDYSKMK